MRELAAGVLIAGMLAHGSLWACSHNENNSGSSHVSKEYIKDNQFRVIGSIDTQSNGNQRAYDAHFRTVGTYDCRADRTYDASFRTVGNGNQLVGLIWRAAGK
ncbi:hypothetical protein [Caballeronia glebae]|uniref:hypothetical protein n=1 Tax=Caballeronia glebae TaxID=1777143 RepID=UPI0038BD98C7